MQQKPNFLRSAVYVVLLAAVCVIPFALAQRNGSKSSRNPVGVTTPTPTPTQGPCQFQVLIVYADAGPPTQFQTEIQAGIAHCRMLNEIRARINSRTLLFPKSPCESEAECEEVKREKGKARGYFRGMTRLPAAAGKLRGAIRWRSCKNGRSTMRKRIVAAA